MDVLWAPVSVDDEVSIIFALCIPQGHLAQRSFPEFAVGLVHYHVNHIILSFLFQSIQN